MNSKDFTRKDFLKKITAMTIASFGLSSPLFAKPKIRKPRNYKVLKNKNVVLFQGDSITDYGRDKKNHKPNNAWALGPGYTFIASTNLLYNFPERDLIFYNRGVSGNVVHQLAERWDKDTIALKPDVLSILVGVNDYWHILTNGYKGTLTIYEHDYRKLLQRTKKTLPNTNLIIGEPYALKGGKAINSKWNLDTFHGYQQAARRIAHDFGAAFIPYQAIYDEALKKASVDYWSLDGVHPSAAGCKLMSHAWLTTLEMM